MFARFRGAKVSGAIAPAALLALALANPACLPEQSNQVPDPEQAREEPVTEPGPFAVGFTKVTIMSAPMGGPARQMEVLIWYPSADATGQGARYLDMVNRPDVFLDAEPAGDSPLPLLIFSHGLPSTPVQNYYFTEFFASHGWIVAAPTQRHSLERMLSSIPLAEQIVAAPQDARAVLDGLAALDGDHLLAGRVGDTVVMSGQSFGGYATLMASGATPDFDTYALKCGLGEIPANLCTEFSAEQRQGATERAVDERVSLAIAMNPGPRALFDSATVDRPVLMITAGQDQNTPNYTDGNPIWQALPGTAHLRVNFETGGHFTATNMCDLVGFLGEALFPDCGDGYIEPAAAHRAINAYSLAFVRYHLWGDMSVEGILDGSTTLADQVTLTSK